MSRALSRSRQRLASEDGSLLVEVMVSAVLVVLVGLGVLAGFDGAAASSAQIKARAVGAGLAQEDQERMRSLKVSALSNYSNTSTQAVAGVTYTVKSKASWVTDSSSTASCAAGGSSSADYLSATSTVTWPKMGATKPVTVESLIAPPNGTFSSNQGSLAVVVTKGDGTGLSGQSVNLSGPATLSDTTDSQGCVLFGFLPAGNGYTVTLNRAGYVDKQGNATATTTTGVTGEATNTVPMTYDQAGTVTVSADTIKGAGPVSTPLEFVTASHSSLLPPGTRTFGSATSSATVTAANLFPFPSSYTFWAGDCAGSDPRTYAATPPSVTVTPGGSFNVTVHEVGLHFKKGGLDVPSGTVVRATATASGCTGTVSRTVGAGGWTPGVPYGSYDICMPATATTGYRAPGQLATNGSGIVVTLPIVATAPACP
jgi:Tfp pilus assembly protein PilV